MNVTSHWTTDNNFVLTYRDQQLVFPAHELAALRSQEEAVAYIESRLKVFAKLIDKDARSMPKMVTSKVFRQPTREDLVAEIVEQTRRYHRFKDEPFKPDYRNPFT